MKQKQYAASRAHVWAFCEPSERLAKESKNPFKNSTPEQAEGVAIHAAIHAAFDDAAKLSDEMKAILEASDDAAEVVDFCVQVVRHLLSPFTGVKPAIFEAVCDYEDSKIKVAARPDLIVRNDDTDELTVVDFKTGYVPVEAEGNEQLKIYAHAYAVAKSLRPKKITGIIIQPRLSQIEYAPIHYDPDFFANLHTELKKREGRFVVGAHCKNCAALTTCKLFRETAIKYYEPHLRDGLTSRPEDWQKLIAIARPAKKFFEEILSEAKTYFEMGGRLDGIGLTKSGGRRAWVREASKEFIAEKLGINEDRLSEQKTKTPAQVEKIIARDKKDVLRSLVYQPQNLSVNLIGERNFLSSENGEEKFIVVSTAVSEILEAKKSIKVQKTKKTKNQKGVYKS